MVLPLPGALAKFSSAALKNISALDGITKSIPDPQRTAGANITKAATSATTGPGSLFEPIPGFIDGANQNFLGNIATPPSLSPSLQQSSLGDILGTEAVSGAGVDTFLEDNVRLEDVLPAQQIFGIAKNLGNISMYADPLQAYTHIASGSAQIKNLCQEADAIIAKIQLDIANLLTIQTGINYSQFDAMGADFFAGAESRIGEAISAFGILCTQLDVRGKFDSAAVTAFCNTIDAFQNFVTFANVKIQQFDILRKDVNDGLKRLQQIGIEILALIQSTVKFIPAYVASTAFGALFRSLQKKVCAQANIDLQKVLNDVQAFSSVNANDRAKVTANFSWASSLESIKAFICGLQPSTDVVDPGGEFAPLKTAYDAFSSSLTLNDPTSSFSALASQLPTFAASMSTAVIQDNTSDLTSAVASIAAVLATLSVSLAAVCLSSTNFNVTFGAQTSINPDRLVGALDLYQNVGADNAKSTSILNAGDTTTLPVSESTSPGQLAEAMKVRINELPDGNEKDQLTILYERVQARHRATVLAMDFQRRQDSATVFAVDEAEANRRLVNKVVTTFSGLSSDEFDQILE